MSKITFNNQEIETSEILDIEGVFEPNECGVRFIMKNGPNMFIHRSIRNSDDVEALQEPYRKLLKESKEKLRAFKLKELSYAEQNEESNN